MIPNLRPSRARKSIRGRGWKAPRTIAEHKYKIISRAILKVLSNEPMRFSDLVTQVTKAVRNFEGSIAWYVVSCLRELEVQGRVTKHHRPVRYSKCV
jgi:DNA-binding HxlR family transcriptional regulator